MATVPPKSPSVSGIEQRLERVESAVQKQTASQSEMFDKLEKLLYHQSQFFRFWYYGTMVILIISTVIFLVGFVASVFTAPPAS